MPRRRHRHARSQRSSAIAMWVRNKQARGDWEEREEQRCAMQFPDGTRCRNKATGRFGYCHACWKPGR